VRERVVFPRSHSTYALIIHLKLVLDRKSGLLALTVMSLLVRCNIHTLKVNVYLMIGYTTSFLSVKENALSKQNEHTKACIDGTVHIFCQDAVGHRNDIKLI